jgi:uncharacterized membrane protein YccC
MERHPTALQLWFSGIDPGLIRLLTAGRAALALLSIWLGLRLGLLLIYGKVQPTVPLFGVVSGMVLLLFIIDLRPADRKVSLWLATPLFAAALLLGSSLAEQTWITYLILLVLFFVAYFMRRYGTRAGELALVTTVGTYLGSILHPKPVAYPSILICVIFSAAAVYLWEFVIIPYDPVKYLNRSVRAFYHNVRGGVQAVRETLEAGEEIQADIQRLERIIKQINRNRRVIEGLFAAAVSPSLWSQTRLNQLQEEMYKSERGLELLVEASTRLSWHETPKGILELLIEGLRALEDQFSGAAAGEEQDQLYEIGDKLQRQIKANLEEKPGGEWVFNLLRMGIAARQLAQSVANMQKIEIGRDAAALPSSTPKQAKVAQAAFFNKPGKKGGLRLHPTTILGLQAVLAAGLAMLSATLLKMDSPTMVFWTAFVVIAGSTGESLRRITMRLAGVIGGTAIGVALAVLLPDNLILTALCVTICIFFTVYILTISYAWMVFWLNIATLLIITSIGGGALHLLVVRPVSTLLGAAMAALVVMFILPIRIKDRFKAALAEFMKAVDKYIESYAASLTGSVSDDNLGVEALSIDASYKKLEQTLASAVYEYNPLSRSQSLLAGQGTSLAVLKGYVTNLKEDVGEEAGSFIEAGRAELIRSLQERIHANVERLVEGLKEEKGKPAEAPRQAQGEITLEKIAALEGGAAGAVRDRALIHLARINDSIAQIAEGLEALEDSG